MSKESSRNKLLEKCYNMKMKREQLLDICYIVFFITISAFLIIRSKYGIVYVDEGFYLTTPYRMTQGDILFVHEWFPTQLTGLLLYPFMKVVLTLMGSTDGIVLIFRYIYIACQILVSLILFFCYKKYSKLGAMIGSVLFLIFAPYEIPALSYNSMGVMSCAICFSLFSITDNKFLDILTGVLLSFSVLCCPYLAILYFIYVVAVIINIKLKLSTHLLSKKKLLYITIGVGIIFIIFLIYILRNMSIKQFLDVLPYTFKSSYSHNQSLSTKFIQILTIFKNMRIPVLISLIIFIAVSIIGRISRVTKVKNICFLITIINSVYSIYIVYFSYPTINHIMLTQLFAATSVYIIFNNRRVSALFYGVCIPTYIYCLMMHFASDQVLFAMSFPAATAICADVMIIVITYKDNLQSSIPMKRITLVSMFMFLFTQCFIQLNYRLNEIYPETPVSDQTVYVDRGINKGLFVSPENKASFDNLEDDVVSYIDEKHVALITDSPWLYLINNYENCCFSAWISEVTPLDAYWRINKDKMPDTVYVSESRINETRWILDEYGYKLKLYTKHGNYVYSK